MMMMMMMMTNCTDLFSCWIYFKTRLGTRRVHNSRQPCGVVSLSGVTAERDDAARLSRHDFVLHFLTLWPWPLTFFQLILIGGRGIVMDYLSAKFGDISFSRFDFIVRTDTHRQNHRGGSTLYSRDYCYSWHVVNDKMSSLQTTASILFNILMLPADIEAGIFVSACRRCVAHATIWRTQLTTDRLAELSLTVQLMDHLYTSCKAPETTQRHCLLPRTTCRPTSRKTEITQSRKVRTTFNMSQVHVLIRCNTTFMRIKKNWVEV